MAVFSQARFGETDPNITIQRVTAPVDTTTATAIQAFGDLGGQAYLGYRQRELEADLADTGNMIATINAGQDAIQDAVKKGQIDPTTQKFQRIAAAAEQGKISEQRAALEAEIALRTSISLAPGFADQLRKTARETLGFDPTGAALNQLFLSGPDAASNRVTQEMKDLEEADQWVAAGMAKTREEALKYIVGARAAQVKDQIDSRRIRQGEISAGRIGTIGANRVQNKVNEILVGAFKEIRDTGGIQNVETYRNGILSAGEQIKSELEKEMAASSDYLYKPEAYNQMRQRVDEAVQANIAIVDNQDLAKVLSRHQEMLHNLIELTGMSLAPDIAIVNSVGGQAAVTSYLEMMAAAGGDTRLLEELAQVDPQYRFLLDLTLGIEQYAPALKASANGALGMAVERGEVSPDAARAVAKKEALDLANGRREPTPEDVGKIITNLEDTDMPLTALSVMARTTDSYFYADTETRAKVAANFRNTHNQQVANLARILAEKDLVLGWNGRRFVIQDPQGRDIRQLFPQGPVAFRSEEDKRKFTEGYLANLSGAKDQLDLLNNTMLKLAKDRRWAEEFGYADANEWANTLMNSVNIQTAQLDLGEDDGAISQMLGVDEQANLRLALAEGDFDAAIGILSKAKLAGSPISGIENAPMFRQEPTLAGTGTIQRDASGRVISSTFDPVRGTNVTVTDISNEPTPFERSLIGSEGFVSTAQPDPRGISTIGYGHNLEANPLTPEDYEALGIDPSVPAENLELTEQQALTLLRRDVQRTYNQLRAEVPEFEGLDQARREVLLDMGFAMGARGVAGFRRMRAALAEGDYQTAARELLDSEFGRSDLPGHRRRARMLARKLAHGEAALASLGR